MAYNKNDDNKLIDVRKANSKAFLSAFLIDTRLREVSGFDESEDLSTAIDGELPPMNPFDADLREGQIRLLSQPEELTYAVLLRRWGDNAFVVAPFSHFDSPATDEELKTRFDGGRCLQVLQIWNVRTALDATLKKSWLIGNLPQQDIDEAWKVWEWSLGGAELPDSIRERTGVPVTRMDDPRNAYREREAEKFAPFDAEDERHAIFLDADFTLSNPVASTETMTLAAAEKDRGSTALYTIDDGGLLLQVESSPASKELVLSILNAADGSLSSKFDGCPLLDEGKGVLATFEGGVIRLAEKDSLFGDKMVILSPDGEPATLTRVETLA